MTAGGRSRLVVAGLAVAVAVALFAAGCGVRTDDSPRAISADAVPYDLLEPTTSTAPTSTTIPAATTRVSIYLINSDGFLVPVDRGVRDPVEITDVIQALLKGASDKEAAAGLRSAIPRSTELLSTRLNLQTRVLTVNLNGDLLEVAGQEQRLALAQVVYTATALGAVQSVLFQFDGEFTDVPDAKGAAKSTPLERRDYFEFDAVRAATSTTSSTPPAG